MDWEAFFLTLRLALVVSFILMVIGIPVAWWITYSPRKWKFLVEALVALPLVLPPTVLGYYFLVALGPRSPAGRWIESILGHPLPFTFEGLVVASLVYSLPFAVQPFVASFASVSTNLLETSWTLGISKLRTFLRVTIPLSARGILTGVILSFAHTLGEFGVVLMVGGNLPGITRTISIDIYDQVQAMNYAAAGRTSLTLLVLSFAILSFVYAVNRHLLRVWIIKS